MGILKKIFGIGMDVTHYNIKSGKIPQPFSGFKIIHLSDFHCTPKKGTLPLIASEKPDVIFMTGDMTDEKKSYESFLSLLKSALEIAPVYIISGNHDKMRPDYTKLVDTCRNIGATFLLNRAEIIKKSDTEIVIHGIDDPGKKPPQVLNNEFKTSLNELKRKKGYEILLFHRANKLDLLEHEGFDLILSGHMHGGQIRLPFLGGVLPPKSSLSDSGRIFFPKFTGGFYNFGKTDIIVNRGMGNPVRLPRLGNPTEIVSITLEHQDSL